MIWGCFSWSGLVGWSVKLVFDAILYMNVHECCTSMHVSENETNTNLKIFIYKTLEKLSGCLTP